MAEWLAHSEGKNPPVPAQTYQKHISEVRRRAEKNVKGLSPYYKADLSFFYKTVQAASLFHDLGKLDNDNQNVLAKGGGKGLPINHVDAGTKNLLNNDLVESAFMVYAHHIGLQSIPKEYAKAELFLRDPNLEKHTERYLDDYLLKHIQSGCDDLNWDFEKKSNWNGLSRRMALSCIVDADHGDTASNYQKEYPVPIVAPKWEERLKNLDRYILYLSKKGSHNKRTELRNKIYKACKVSDTNIPIYSCDSPVGTGKTTAVIAHLLRTAIDKKLRHIIVILPYTNIIKQSVEVYRNALTLPGEDPIEVVAEHHHQVDFDDLKTRHLATLWKAPIIVTTAVQFFETIASNHPSKLRKLHELPGSGIFVDETHAAITNHLWPQTWKWIKELTTNWGCYFVLASGSLPRFWELKHLMKDAEEIPELIPKHIRDNALQQEAERIKPISYPAILSDQDLINLVLSKTSPRLIIMNTVQSAAVLADKLAVKFYGEKYKININKSKILHLSTSLAPIHREKIIKEIEKRLRLSSNDKRRDFSLVATSCVEAGLDFSFVSAFRERASASNLIQIGGRVRRNIENFEPTLIDFTIDAPLFNHHPGFTLSRQILKKIFDEDLFKTQSPTDIVTEALRRELMSDTSEKHKKLLKMEDEMDYPEVANLYRVIDSDTRLVLIDADLTRAIENYERVNTKDLMARSVQIWAKKINDLGLLPLVGFPGSNIFKWIYAYDEHFLGYMKGVLPVLKTNLEGFQII